MRVTLVELLLPLERVLNHCCHLHIHLADQIVFLFVLIDFIPQEGHGFVDDGLIKLELVPLPLDVLSQVVDLLWEEVHQRILQASMKSNLTYILIGPLHLPADHMILVPDAILLPLCISYLLLLIRDVLSLFLLDLSDLSLDPP